MKKLFIASTALVASAQASLAATGGCSTNPLVQCPQVPEISALEGSAAIAALVAVVLLTWERRRRRAV